MGVSQRDGLWFGRAVPGTTGCGAGSGGPSQPREGTHSCVCGVRFSPQALIPVVWVGLSQVASPAAGHRPGEHHVCCFCFFCFLKHKSGSDSCGSLFASLKSLGQMFFYSPVSFVTPRVLKRVSFAAFESLCRDSLW